MDDKGTVLAIVTYVVLAMMNGATPRLLVLAAVVSIGLATLVTKPRRPESAPAHEAWRAPRLSRLTVTLPAETVRVAGPVRTRLETRTRTSTRTVTAEPDTVDSGDDGGATSFANCTEARAAGVTPLLAGDPGYDSHLDRDHDGVACE